MITRLYALYDGSKRLLTFMVACFVAEQVVNVTILAINFRNIRTNTFMEMNILGYSTCLISSSALPSWLMATTNSIFLLFQTIVIVLTLYRFTVHLKDTNQRLSWELLCKDDIWVILVRDNIMFYLVSTFPLIFDTILLVDSYLPKVPSLDIYVIVITLQTLWISIVGPHIILNIKSYKASARMSGATLPFRSGQRNRDVELHVIIHTEVATSK